MEALKIDISKVFGFVPRADIYSLSAKGVESAPWHLKRKPEKAMIFWDG